MLEEVLKTEMKSIDVQVNNEDEVETLLGTGCGALIGCGGCNGNGSNPTPVPGA